MIATTPHFFSLAALTDTHIGIGIDLSLRYLQQEFSCTLPLNNYHSVSTVLSSQSFSFAFIKDLTFENSISIMSGRYGGRKKHYALH